MFNYIRKLSVLCLNLFHFISVTTIVFMLVSNPSSVWAYDYEKFLNDAKKVVNELAKQKNSQTSESDTQSQSVDTEKTPPAYDRAMLKDIQIMLRKMDYQYGMTDGNYRVGTKLGIEEFQHDRGLAVDGQPSYSLVTAMQSAIKEGHKKPSAHATVATSPSKTKEKLPTKSSTTNDEKTAWVKCNRPPEHDDEDICYPKYLWGIMRNLNKMGYRNEADPYSLSNEGLHPKHRAAIRDFQHDHSMLVDGRATNRLRKQVNVAYKEYKDASAKAYEAEQQAKKNNWIEPKTEKDIGTACAKIGISASQGAAPTPEQKTFFKANCQDTGWTKWVN